VIDYDPYNPNSGRPAGDDEINWLPADQVGYEPTDYVEVLDCWRCGKEIEATSLACPYCRARMYSAELRPELARRLARELRDPVASVIHHYLGIFAFSLAYAAIRFSILANGLPVAEIIRYSMILSVLFVLVEAAFTIHTIARAGRPRAFPPVSGVQKASVWVAILPIFALLMTANFTYMHWLKQVFHVVPIQDNMGNNLGAILFTLFEICIAPAVFEELFFRYLALGHLREIVGIHTAVWISSAMFGFAHIFNPLAIPYLILAGAVFAYARIYGRSMILPMLLHFSHNAIVIWFNPWP
jgi:membrane protease YdiL (CAAX protease family)